MKRKLLLAGVAGIVTTMGVISPAFACTATNYSANYTAQNYSTYLDGNNIGALTGVVRGFAQVDSNNARTMVVQGWGSYWWDIYFNRPDGHINWIEFAISTPSDSDYMLYGSPEPAEVSSWTPPLLLSWAVGYLPYGGFLDAIMSMGGVSNVSHEGSVGRERKIDHTSKPNERREIISSKKSRRFFVCPEPNCERCGRVESKAFAPVA